MFSELLETAIGTPDASRDQQLRTNELQLRRLVAERAALVAATDHQGSYRSDGHRSIGGFLRSHLNTGAASVDRDRKLARLLSEHPPVGDALLAGRITADHALEIARLDANPRVRELLPTVLGVLLDLAEHSSHREFADAVTGFIMQLDQDGAFDDLADAVEGRRAGVVEVGGEVAVHANGGDPVQAGHLVAIFESFVDAEFRADVEARRTEFGDAADQHELPRTSAQRGFDALFAIFSAAYASPAGRRLPDLVTNLVVDADTAHDALATAGLVLPSGDVVELDDAGEVVDEAGLLTGLAGELTDDPDAFFERTCKTESGTPIHSSVVLRALLTGHVRRVVMDSRSVVVDYGTKQRLFTGLARAAATLMVRRCEHPGCDLPARWSQVDHNIEWTADGRTDQRNRNIECGHHNRFKHRQRWRTRRDARGRAYTIRPDGTIVLPVGERKPDLSIDELTEAARARLHRDVTRDRSAV